MLQHAGAWGAKDELPIEIDLGPNSNGSVDYPDYAKKLAKRLKKQKSDIGILVCGSGTGMAISANKIKGIRAAVCYSATSTRPQQRGERTSRERASP